MPRYLLDTHALLWYSQQPSQLPTNLVEALQQLDAATYISRISLLEIAIKHSIGKLELSGSLAQWLAKTAAIGFEAIEITDQHLVALAVLPLLPNHRDPFDRLLIAQALSDDLTLVSRDAKFEAYPGLKLRWA